MKNKKKTNHKHQRSQLFAIWQLLERGWTRSMINNLIPNHDDERCNPHYKSAPRMKFYIIQKACGYERGKKWQTLYAESLPRIEAGKRSSAKGIATRKRNKEKRIKAKEEKLKLTKFCNETSEIDTLLDRMFDRNKSKPKASPLTFAEVEENALMFNDSGIKKGISSQAKVNSVVVDYLINTNDTFNSILSFFDKEIGQKRTESILTEGILKHIANTYPELKRECNTRLTLCSKDLILPS